MPLQGANPTPSFGGFGLTYVAKEAQRPESDEAYEVRRDADINAEDRNATA